MATKVEELLRDIERAYDEEQQLDLQPTHPNVLIMADVLGALKSAHNFISGLPKEETKQEVTEDVQC